MNSETHRKLSAKKLEILKLKGQGLCHKRVARRLNISPATVAYHLRETREILGTANTTEATSMMARARVI